MSTKRKVLEVLLEAFRDSGLPREGSGYFIPAEVRIVQLIPIVRAAAQSCVALANRLAQPTSEVLNQDERQVTVKLRMPEIAHRAIGYTHWIANFTFCHDNVWRYTHGKGHNEGEYNGNT